MISQLNLFFLPLNPIYTQNCITFLPIYLTIWRRPAPTINIRLNQQIINNELALVIIRTRRNLSTLLYIHLTTNLYSQEITLDTALWSFHRSLCDIDEDHVLALIAGLPHTARYCVWYADVSQSTVMKITRVHSKHISSEKCKWSAILHRSISHRFAAQPAYYY